MSRFRLFGNFGGDKTGGKDTSKNKDAEESLGARSSEGDTQNRKDAETSKNNSEAFNINFTPSKDSTSTIVHNDGHKKPGDSKLDDHKRPKTTPLNKDQKIKNLDRLVAQKDEEINRLRKIVDNLSMELEKLNINLNQKKINEENKIKNRRLQDLSTETTPGNLTVIESSLVKHPKSTECRSFLYDAITKNEYLGHHDKNHRKEMVECMWKVVLPKDTVLINQEDETSSFFVVESGVLRMIQNNVRIGTLTAGNMTGESSILYKCPASTTCIADSETCVLWELNRKTYKNIMLKQHIKLQKEYAQLLRNVPILTQVPEQLMISVIGIVQELTFEKGVTIFNQGQLGKSFYIIKEGSVNLYKKQKQQGSKPLLIKRLGKSSYFGEMALMCDERRQQDAISGENGCVVLSIENDDFTSLIEIEEADFDHRKIPTPPTISTSNTSRTAPSMLSTQQTITSGYSDFSEQVPKYMSTDSYKNEEFTIHLEDLKSLATLAHNKISYLELVHLKGDPKSLFLLKHYKKRNVVDSKFQDKVIAEKKILQMCDCAFIIRLHKTFKDRKYLYMLLEGCSGGELSSLLHQSGRFDDQKARFYTGCVIEALIYLHKHSIVFRSFKTEGVFIDEHGYAKITDLLSSKRLGSTRRTWSFTGKAEYVAPEVILNKGYDLAVDYWSLGVFVFELTSGYLPFRGQDNMKTYNIILKGLETIVLPNVISKHACSLIKKLCRLNPNERLGYLKGSWAEVKKQKWFEGLDFNKLNKKQIIAPLRPNICERIDHVKQKFFKDDEIPPDENTGWDKDF